MDTRDQVKTGTLIPALLPDLCKRRWKERVVVTRDDRRGVTHLKCQHGDLADLCQFLSQELAFVFATLVVEEQQSASWSLTYVYYKDRESPWLWIELGVDASEPTVPSISWLSLGPSVDWHEREAEDLFGLTFEGHPRLGEFVLHEDWPEGVNPMRRDFAAQRRIVHHEPDARWEPPTIVEAPGAFAMPIGPVFSDFAESAHFLLETVGEDVIRTIPRFFYKYRGVEKIAEGQTVDRILLLAERFAGTSAFAHGLAACQAVEEICGIPVPRRGQILRTVFAELERLRHHAAAITGICNSTALAVATSQASMIEEDLLRVSCEMSGHRYFFGALAPGGVTCDLDDARCDYLVVAAGQIGERLRELHEMLRYSSSFLDRLEEVGIIKREDAVAYGLVGPIARASGVDHDLRKVRPYGAYDSVEFAVPVESEGDGYARLRVLFQETQQSVAIIRRLALALPAGGVCAANFQWRAGVALGAVEAPAGATFHWLRIRDDGTVTRYRITPPSFANWHGFHLAAENFAFQDFPIILASFGLSNAECDR